MNSGAVVQVRRYVSGRSRRGRYVSLSQRRNADLNGDLAEDAGLLANDANADLNG
jgi:hypothetical protein